jgi:hypothetical protein
MGQDEGTFSSPASSHPSGSDLERVKRKLHEYAVKVLAPDVEDADQVVRKIEHMVVRVPAVCFNEQKLEDQDGYQVNSKRKNCHGACDLAQQLGNTKIFCCLISKTFRQATE